MHLRKKKKKKMKLLYEKFYILNSQLLILRTHFYFLASFYCTYQ